MPIPYTTEQLLGLAPNYYHIKSSRSMASVEKWRLLGRDPDGMKGVAWGEFVLKNKPPVQTSVNLANLAFSCTCSGRRFPCTHALALALLLHDQPESFDSLSVPAWLQEIPESRESQSEGIPLEELATQIQKRQQHVEGGLQELKLWLHDLVRGGLAQARTKPKAYWGDMSNRLVDAQAGEVARTVKQLPTLLNSGPNWPEQLLNAIGKLYLLIQGFENFATLDASTQSDLRGAVGWFPRQTMADRARNTVRTTVTDHWFILGKQIDVQRKQKVQRTWLWGQESNRPALLVNVTYDMEPTNTTLLAGMSIDAELLFFPSNAPLRAEIVVQESDAVQSEPVDGNSSIQSVMASYAQALSANPWIGHYPVTLSNIQVQRTDGRWFVQDNDGTLLSLPPKFVHGWHLASLGHSQQLSLFGEWDGATLTPLSIWTEERFVEIHLMRGLK